ncbi:O-acetylserine lyase [Marinicauda salina]|uniref:Cysteine synthase B n=1 Tax=Marinicauda salina TaxID=2135793 RepID=A0A2U2BXC0_9PROT|nr:pyridoxal-phosphate dependent enzyme [Marinicauda salina]PWE18619.1 O-acetylserine lyase [Marinicauda salina]
MARIHDDIVSTIGGTPVVELKQLAPPHVRLFAKIEAFNPGGSVKDRLAIGVIEAAERAGALKPGQTVVEATSGNTGIGLAVVCAAKGYPLVVTMAENFSVERRKLMRFLGAQVVLTPAAEKGTGMLRKARELAETHGWFLARQFENEANADIHSATTAREILDDFEGRRLDYWVTGFGTGGTLKGVARVLRQARPETRIVVAEPDNSPLLGSGLRQARGDDGAPTESHPVFRPHLMQGWSPDFIAKLAEDAGDAGWIDQVVAVAGEDALARSRDLARKCGVFAGTSAGATLAGALAVAEDAPEGSAILCMLPDTGERYLSTPLFAEIAEDMTDDEIALSESTPSSRFAAPAPAREPEPAPEPEAEPLDAEAEAYVGDVVGDADKPVVMFALEWCEFCWSARRIFAALGVDYRSVDLDSVAFQKDDLGGRIRPVLKARTGEPTIPQIFVGGELVGGCSELVEACGSGRLDTLLDAAGVKHAPATSIDPERFLPQWIQPRAAAVQ